MDRLECQIKDLWNRIELLKQPGLRRFELGEQFYQLRRVYSERERNSGGQSAGVVGHGRFEAECLARGWRPRTVRELIRDFQIEWSRITGHADGAKTSAEQRRSRRARAKRNHPAKEGGGDPVSVFAHLLPFKALQTGYREAAKSFHPDYGGSTRKMQQLNEAWDAVRVFYKTPA